MGFDVMAGGWLLLFWVTLLGADGGPDFFSAFMKARIAVAACDRCSSSSAYAFWMALPCQQSSNSLS
eukprot:6468167-Amphidinium_carterae.1